METIFILGSHPELSIAEILRTLAKNIKIIHATDTALFADVPKTCDLSALQVQLGGTIKIAKPLFSSKSFPSSDAIAEKITPQGDSKWQFGFSLYDTYGEKRKKWDRLGIDLKKAWRAEGHSVRFVTTRESILSTIVVQKEGMLTGGADICVLEGPKGITFAQTVAAQDPRELAKRDYGKAKRPTRVGMLPIKLAKIMINLAAQEKDATIIDPFMGSGTVLTELLLAGHDATSLFGSDKAKRAVEHTRENLEDANLPLPTLTALDATELHTQHQAESVDAIVTEGHLGLPKTDADRKQYKKEMEKLYANVLISYSMILKPNGVIVMAFPAYKLDDGTLLNLQLSKALETAKLKPHKMTQLPHLQTERDSFIYGRPNQRVLREIYILHK